MTTGAADPQPVDVEVEGSTDHDRAACPYDFVVAMGPDMAAALGLGGPACDGVVVTRWLAGGGAPSKRCPLRVNAVLRLDGGLAPGRVRMDQTLRTALGIAYELGRHTRNDLGFSRLTLDRKQAARRLVVRVLGVRYMYARVEKARPSDIEKNICRVNKDMLAILGTGEGSRVVLLAPRPAAPATARLGLLSVKAFDLSEAMRTEREAQSRDHAEKGWNARYVNAAELLSLRPDILPVYLDAHARSALGVEPGDPVKLRRDFPDLFKQQLLEVGVALALSTLALTRLFPDDLQKSHYWVFVGLSVGTALATTCAAIVARLRARVP